LIEDINFLIAHTPSEPREVVIEVL